MRTNIREEAGSVTTGFLIFSGLITVLYALSVGDNTYLVFGILLLFTFTLAASVGGQGNTDSDLEAIGWSNKNMGTVVPLGIAGGILALIIGSFIISLSAKNTASTVPDFSAVASVFPMYKASIIPASIATAVNIIAQWTIVAPSEEAAYRILAPFAGMAVFKNQIMAYAAATILWLATHINAYTMQGTPSSMYLVLAMIAVITIGLLWWTGSAISGIIAHAVFNSGVILMAGNAGQAAYFVVLVILAILVYGWLTGMEKSRNSRRGGVV